MVAQRKPQESTADKLYRLLQKGKAEGVEILMDGDTEHCYATSGAIPGIIYAVTETSCSG